MKAAKKSSLVGSFHRVQTRPRQFLRPAHVFAKPSADGELQIVALLQGPWRFALCLIMIWLSLRGLTASEIAALFEYDTRTVRRWIDRYNREGVAGLEDRRRSGAPRLGGAGLSRRIRMLLRQPRAWTVKQLRRALGYPAMSLATLARRVREQASWRRPRLTASMRRPGARPPPSDAGTRGLWLANQLCDRVQLRSFIHAAVVRLHLEGGSPAPTSLPSRTSGKR